MSDYTIAGEASPREKKPVFKRGEDKIKMLKKKRYSNRDVSRAREMTENSSSHYAKRPDQEGRVY